MTVQFDPNTPAVTPRDAATIILLRDTPNKDGVETFFVKRRADIRFMGGAYVFPGGKLDPDDTSPSIKTNLTDNDLQALSVTLGETDPIQTKGLFVAAVRECLEEAGVLFSSPTLDEQQIEQLRHACDVEHQPLSELLTKYNITLTLDALKPLSRWITPKLETRRFDARFFLAALPPQSIASHDTRETVASVWLRPEQAIERAVREEIVLVPPTWKTVQWLTQYRTVHDALEDCPSPVPCIEPNVLLLESNEVHVLLPGDPEHGQPYPQMTHRKTSSGGTPQLPVRFVYNNGAWKALQ